MAEKHTTGPWHVGAQNDLLFIVAGRAPAINNDYPVHDAARTVISQIEECDKDRTEVEANARLIAAAPELLEMVRVLALSDADLAGSVYTSHRPDDTPIIYCDTTKREITLGHIRGARALLARIDGEQA